MKTLFTVVTLLLFTSGNTTVYVCISPSAKKYHYSRSCSGLQRCTHEIKAMSADKAEKMGYTVCLKES